MDKFTYTIITKRFEKATTIKERVQIFREVLNSSTEVTPFRFKLATEIEAQLRSMDIRKVDTDNISRLKARLRQHLLQGRLATNEIQLVFKKDDVIHQSNLPLESYIAVCNSMSNLIYPIVKVQVRRGSYLDRLQKMNSKEEMILRSVACTKHIKDYKNNPTHMRNVIHYKNLGISTIEARKKIAENINLFDTAEDVIKEN